MRYAIGVLLLLPQMLAFADEPLQLVNNGHAECFIVTDKPEDYAVERLSRFLKTYAPDMPFPTGEVPADGSLITIIISDYRADGLAGKTCADAGVKIDPANLTEQGYVLTTFRYQDRPYLLMSGGGPEGTLYAVTDFINWHASADGNSLYVPFLNVRQVPKFQYRWFWNWDHRMDWGGPGRIGTEMGGGGTYCKNPEAFVIDCKRCIDYMSDHKFNGLILWGFLRDTHGGIEAAQEICKYAKGRYVRILPGVGSSGYAGYYFEGKHEFNADTWLAKHPELSALEKDGTPKKDNSPCPSKKANLDWLDRGAKWLFDSFEIGGVNMEMGDFYVCYCDDCKKMRAKIPSDEPDYYKDMAISHSRTLQTMRSVAPNAWLSYATYTGYNFKMVQNPPKFLSMIPEDALCQWTLTEMAGNWPENIKPLAKHNIGYLHWCNRATKTENDFYLDQIKSICHNAANAGFEGLVTYGELSRERPNVELFYLAWEAFLWDPEMTIETFAHKRLSRLYGGDEAAKMLAKIIPLIQTQKQQQNPENMAKALEMCANGRNAASPYARAAWDRVISCVRGRLSQ